MDRQDQGRFNKHGYKHAEWRITYMANKDEDNCGIIVVKHWMTEKNEEVEKAEDRRKNKVLAYLFWLHLVCEVQFF